MKKVSIYALTLILLASTALAYSATVKADSTISVYINDPFNQTNGNKELSLGGYYVGEIPITLTDGTSNPVQTTSYCMDFDRVISVGGTYPASLTPAADNAEWRAVSYLLTWNQAASNNDAAADQVAI